MTERLEADSELLAAVAIAAEDGVAIQDVYNRGRADLVARLAYAEYVRQKVRHSNGA
jgi:hypothetical protein